MKFVILLALALLCASASTVSATGSGLSGSTQSLTSLWPLVAQVVDPTSNTLIFEGSFYDGSITFHSYDPNTTCIVYNGTTSCGEQAFDTTFVFATSCVFPYLGCRVAGVSNLYLKSLVNNPGPHNTGNITDVVLGGYWTRSGELLIDISYRIYNQDRPGIDTAVGVHTVFSILLDNSNIANYQGLFFTRAIPYIEIFGVWQSSPYEAVCIAGQPFSGDAQPFVAIPHHAITPYPATVNATTPVAAYQVTCTLTNIELLTANTFTAAANCYTPDEVAFNKNGILTGTYFQNPLVANQYHVTYSAFVTSNTDQFLLDATSVILPIN